MWEGVRRERPAHIAPIADQQKAKAANKQIKIAAQMLVDLELANDGEAQ